MTHRQQLQSLAKQLEVLKAQHNATGAQIDALAQELSAVFQTAPPEEAAVPAQYIPPKYVNAFPG